MIWLVLVVIAGGAGLAWFLDRELNPRDHRPVHTVTVTIHADIGPFLEALNRIRTSTTNLDRSTTMTVNDAGITATVKHTVFVRIEDAKIHEVTA